MSDDILTRIDDTLTDTSACFCGCQKRIPANGASPWFASEECQVRWNVRRITSKSSIEERPEPVEAAPRPSYVDTIASMVDVRLFEPGDRVTVTMPDSSPVMYEVTTADQIGAEMQPVFVAPASGVYQFTSSCISTADVAAGPSTGADPAVVDTVRRIQDGTAPAPARTPGCRGCLTSILGPCVTCREEAIFAARDHVAEAMRAEVLRQGLTECEIDGRREVYRDGAWEVAPTGIVTALPEPAITAPATDVWSDIVALYDRLRDARYAPTPPPILTRQSAELYNAEMARLQAAADRLETLSLECGMGNPLCSGCDGAPSWPRSSSTATSRPASSPSHPLSMSL